MKTQKTVDDYFAKHAAWEEVLTLLRTVIYDTELEETLKWGEPSYLVKKGSTIRMDWKVKTPDQYAMYFKCTSKLVPTFRELFGDLFKYEKNRAILFPDCLISGAPPWHPTLSTVERGSYSSFHERWNRHRKPYSFLQ